VKKGLLLILLPLFNCVQAQESEALRARLNVVREDIFVLIEAVVENNAFLYNDKLNYHLLSLKKQAQTNKYEKSDRYGDFTLLPNENKVITSIKVNLEEEQELKIYLFVKEGKRLVAQDSIKINEVVDLLKTTYLKEVEIEIKGLVVENTKTKFGKDFYDAFYQLYLRKGTNYPFVVNINEKPFPGTGSLISVEVEDQNIIEFQTRPDLEYLEKAAEYALERIENYNKNRKKVEKVY